MKNVIIFKDADITSGESIVVYGLNMAVNEGDLVYIVGKVGTGKTSIIRTMIAENPLEKGSGEVCGFDLTKLRSKDIPMLRRRLGVVFQDFQLLMDRSVEANLDFVLKSTGWKDREAITLYGKNRYQPSAANIPTVPRIDSVSNASPSPPASQKKIETARGIRRSAAPNSPYKPAVSFS